MEKYEIINVPAQDVDTVLPYIEHFMADVEDYTEGRVSVGETLAEVEAGRRTLWVMMDRETGKVDCYFTLHVYQTPRMRILACEQVGGTNVRKWAKQQVEFLRTYAKEYGCGRVEGYGRVGWERFLKPLGFKLQAVAVSMDV